MRSTFAVRETASLGQQMLNAPVGINGVHSLLRQCKYCCIVVIIIIMQIVESNINTFCIDEFSTISILLIQALCVASSVYCKVFFFFQCWYISGLNCYIYVCKVSWECHVIYQNQPYTKSTISQKVKVAKKNQLIKKKHFRSRAHLSCKFGYFWTNYFFSLLALKEIS